MQRATQEAYDIAEGLVNHQFGTSVFALAHALDNFYAKGAHEAVHHAIMILLEEGFLGDSLKRIRALTEWEHKDAT